jgi:hypothetical protein
MAYPLSAPVVEQAYTTITNDLQQLKAACQAVVTGTAAGASAQVYLALNAAQAAIAYRTDFAIIAANSALVAQLVPYVQAQSAGASALAVQTEYTTLNTLAGNLLNAFALDYPHDASARLLDRTFSLTTGITWLNFTAAQAPNFMPTVTALVNQLT